MPENETIIHIGMPKCASTTLQKNFFLQLPSINYAGLGKDTDLTAQMNSIFQKDDIHYNENQIRQNIDSATNPDLPFVISNEFYSNFNASFLSRHTIQSRSKIARRFKSLFPEAKILIIIRNQYDMQKSIYAQKKFMYSNYVKTNKLTFRHWIDLNIYDHNLGWSNIFEYADYYSLINFYFSMFENVKVVVFEEMVKDIKVFLKNELCPYIGIDGEEAMKYYIDEVANKRHTKAEIILNKYIHRGIAFLQKKLGNPQKAISEEKREAFRKKLYSFTNSIKLGKIKTEFTEEQKQFMLDYYGENNRKLSEMIGVDLGKYGYPIK